MSQSVAVVGVGVVGSRVARQLTASQVPVWVHDVRRDMQTMVAKTLRAQELIDIADLRVETTPVVVIATRSSQATMAKLLLELGHHVVTTSDDVQDTHELLALDELARRMGRALVIGATASPGLSGLLVAELATRVDAIDEIHVAFHGTGGPECARQHHRALAGDAVGWHDGQWLNRPSGSGRELLWFPEPIGGKDCYRAELPDPLLLHAVYPDVARISARLSANRRDRLTARLPMLAPPHAEGGIGGVRVEIRGSLNGARCTEVAGAAERTGIIAGAVAATMSQELLKNNLGLVGAVVLGDPALDNRSLLDAVISRGVTVYEYFGSRA